MLLTRKTNETYIDAARGGCRAGTSVLPCAARTARALTSAGSAPARCGRWTSCRHAGIHDVSSVLERCAIRRNSRRTGFDEVFVLYSPGETLRNLNSYFITTVTKYVSCEYDRSTADLLKFAVWVTVWVRVFHSPFLMRS